MCLDLAIRHIEGIADPLSAPSPWYVLVELATASPIDDLRAKLEAILAEAMEQGRVSDGVIAESEAQRAALWRIREEQAEAGRREGGGVACDVSVPVSRVAGFLARAEAMLREQEPEIRLNTFGHMGDGNIHYLILRPLAMGAEAWQQRSYDLVDRLNGLIAEMGGSFSAEHGIGAQKRADLVRYAAPSRLTLMRAVKAAIDPANVMNPGKIL
jgi:FAD/FMN-containing dehydrogenase